MTTLMRTRAHSWPLLALALVAVLLGAAACAVNFQKAAATAATEKAIVEDAFKQAVRLYDQKLVKSADYETIKAAYNVWAGSQRVQFDVLKSWRDQIADEQRTGKSSTVDWQGKYEAAAKAASAAYLSFVALVGDLVRLRTGALLPAPPGDAIHDVDYLERASRDVAGAPSLPFALAVLPLGLTLGGRRRRPGDPAPPIAGGAGATDQVEAGLKLALALISQLQGKAAEYAALGLNYLPFVVAIGHVAETAYAKVQEMVGSGGPDFLTMSEEEFHARLLPKTVEQLETEARA